MLPTTSNYRVTLKRQRNILVVEDELIIALMIEQMLERLGHIVVDKVSTGEAAVEAAEKHKPDLILMDIRIQGDMDGIETVKKIRSKEDIPVIFISGNSDETYRSRVEEMDHLDFLTKPVSYHALDKSLDMAS